MKTLNQHIKESLQSKAICNESILDDEEDLINLPVQIIKEFIKDNYKITGKFDIKKSNNKYIVDCSGNVEVKNRKITQLNNALFEWNKVGGLFDCRGCKSLTSLKGAPKEVYGDFNCSYCNALTTLKDAPKEVGGWFNCSGCDSLTSLKGAPKEVGWNFNCDYCNSLTSLQGVPEKVGGWFNCSGCKSLTSLKGAPKEVYGDFRCDNCGTQFEKEDVEKVSRVKGEIQV